MDYPRALALLELEECLSLQTCMLLYPEKMKYVLEEYEHQQERVFQRRNEYNQAFDAKQDLYYKEKYYIYAKECLRHAREHVFGTIRILQLQKNSTPDSNT